MKQKCREFKHVSTSIIKITREKPELHKFCPQRFQHSNSGTCLTEFLRLSAQHTHVHAPLTVEHNVGRFTRHCHGTPHVFYIKVLSNDLNTQLSTLSYSVKPNMTCFNLFSIIRPGLESSGLACAPLSTYRSCPIHDLN